MLENETLLSYKEENQYWDEFGDSQSQMKFIQEEQETLKMKNHYAEVQLKLLAQKNVYQDTFFISTSDKIGTISDLRLGRLPGILVEWEEINAAWGQASVLLYTIAKKVGFLFSKFRLRPMGSRSSIQSIAVEKTVYPLYGSNDLGFGSWFSWGFGRKPENTFDDGMTAFLQCLKEMCEFGVINSSGFLVIYKINKDRIGDQSIRMTTNSEDSWTKALKNVLTTLNYLLVWISSGKDPLQKFH